MPDAPMPGAAAPAGAAGAAAPRPPLDAFRAFTDELTGGGEPAAEAPGTVPAMAGAGGVPVSHGRPA